MCRHSGLRPSARCRKRAAYASVAVRDCDMSYFIVPLAVAAGTCVKNDGKKIIELTLRFGDLSMSTP
jgi:hypothetical protein